MKPFTERGAAMIVSDEYRYVFVEQPLTASTAIASELVEHYGGYKVLSKHSNYADFWRQADRGQREYRVVIGVRNPLDQIVSGYQKLRNNHMDAYDDPSLFEENGGWISRRRREMFRFVHADGHSFSDYFQQYFGRRRVKVSQYTWFPRRYDSVIRFERIQEDFAAFLETIGARPVRALPIVNKTAGKRDFTTYYTPDTYEQARFAFGPIMAHWQYELPADWPARDVPAAASLQFHAINAVARFVVTRLGLTPEHYRRLRAALASPGRTALR